MIYFIGYMLIGLAISIWSLNGDEDKVMEILKCSGVEETWLLTLLVALGIVLTTLLWPISVICFIKLCIEELTENK